MVETVWLNENQAAKVLNRPVGTLRRWRFRKIGPPWYKACGQVRYIENELITWLPSNRVDPGAKPAEAI